MDATRLINLTEILICNSRKRSKQYLLIAAGLYPRPIRLGRSSLWLAVEDETVRRAVISGKSDDEIREIVRELEAARKVAYSQTRATADALPRGIVPEQTARARLGTPAAPE